MHDPNFILPPQTKDVIIDLPLIFAQDKSQYNPGLEISSYVATVILHPVATAQILIK